MRLPKLLLFCKHAFSTSATPNRVILLLLRVFRRQKCVGARMAPSSGFAFSNSRVHKLTSLQPQRFLGFGKSHMFTLTAIVLRGHRVAHFLSNALFRYARTSPNGSLADLPYKGFE